MTLDEADKIIAELSLVFPNKKLTVEEVYRWEENLQPYPYETARETIRHLERTLRFFPVWADFYESIQPTHMRQLREADMERLQLAKAEGDEPCSVEENLRQIALIKEKLAKRFTAD
jgi:hypothetical protein